MRESIFEKYKKRKLNYNVELKKIRDLIREREHKYNTYFKESNVAFLGIDFFDALKNILGMDIRKYGQYEFLDPLDSLDVSLNQMLDTLEFIRNILPNSTKDSSLSQMQQIINSCIVNLGYAFMKDEENRFVLYLKNPEAESVATMVEKSIAAKIYEYLMIREGNVIDKRKALKSLSDDVEVICTKYRSDKDINKVSQIMQCIRHPKEKMQPKYPFFFENEEKWLDRVFEMFLFVLSTPKVKEYVKDFDLLVTKINK